jgi:hypothetical protein
MKIIPSSKKNRYIAIASIVLVAVLTVVIVAVMVPDGNQDSPWSREIEKNPRHPLGEIIELEGPSSLKDLKDCERFQHGAQEFKGKLSIVNGSQVLVGHYVQEFYHSEDFEDFKDDVLYRDIGQDGSVRIGVTCKDIIEKFKELCIPITFEIIDLEEVRHLEEAAREIDKKSYVEGARYDYSAGRIRVSFDKKKNWGRYEDIYQEYPDYPLFFRLVVRRSE